MSDDHGKQQVKLIDIVRQVIERDEALRDKFGVKDKFRFVRDRLQALMAQLESDLEVAVSEDKKQMSIELGPDEVKVYVYLFNAHGATLRSWQNMLLPKVFYEYSVNRPVYAEKNQIEAVIRSKSSWAQHGYITVAIKKADIHSSTQKDSQGNETLKIKEGSLHFSKLISFTHNELDYFVTEQSELIKKDP